jgi:transcriptional regulator NrdR family protein
MVKVCKKDSRIEEFDREKIVLAVIGRGKTKTGATKNQAEKIAADVENWVNRKASNDLIDSTQIREKVLKELRKTNPSAADVFEFY